MPALARRDAMLGAVAAAFAGGAAMAATNPDADLIRLCDALIAAGAAYEHSDGNLEPEDDPLWSAIQAIEEQLDGMQATTIAGVLAKVRVAASWARQPDGSENWSTSYTGDWPEQVCRDLLALT